MSGTTSGGVRFACPRQRRWLVVAVAVADSGALRRQNFVGYEQAHVNHAFDRGDDEAFLVATPFDLDARPTKPARTFNAHGSFKQ